MGLPDRLASHQVVHLVAAVSANEYGDEERDWAAAERVDFTGWLQQDRRAVGDRTSRVNPAEQEWSLLTNYLALSSGDRVEWAEHPAGLVTFEVVGPPEPAYRSAGELHHVEATLRIYEG